MLTKLLKARTNEPASHIGVPSAARRPNVDMISTTWASRGGLASDIPNRTRRARTVSGSLVMSGPSWIKVCTNDVPGGRLEERPESEESKQHKIFPYIPESGEDTMQYGCDSIIPVLCLSSDDECLPLVCIEGRRVGWGVGEEIGH